MLLRVYRAIKGFHLGYILIYGSNAMHATIQSATTLGITAYTVDVEVDISLGMVNLLIVGLPDKAIKESKERIRAAFKNSGISLPDRLITVNLAPATLKKEDILFDVPIAIGIMQAAAMLDMTQDFLSQTIFLGELSLDCKIRGVRGVLSIVHKAAKDGKRRVIVPRVNAAEASLIEGIEVIGVQSLQELVVYYAVRLRKNQTQVDLLILSVRP